MDGEICFPEFVMISADSSCSMTLVGVTGGFSLLLLLAAVLVVVIGGDSAAILAVDLVLMMELKSSFC
jgi:hypothetical protein